MFPDVPETVLCSRVNHGRRLASLEVDWDHWDLSLAEPSVGSESNDAMDIYAEAMASIVLAAVFAGLRPEDLWTRTTGSAAFTLIDGSSGAETRYGE